MSLFKPYEHPIHEADLEIREKMMFFDPFHAAVLEGGHETEQDLNTMVILSSN